MMGKTSSAVIILLQKIIKEDKQVGRESFSLAVEAINRELAKPVVSKESEQDPEKCNCEIRVNYNILCCHQLVAHL